MITKFDFEDALISEKEILEQNIKPLVAKKLKQLIFGKHIFGNYFIGRMYQLHIDTFGKMKGVNDIGTQDLGQCFIDETQNTLSTKWTNGWDNWKANAYLISNEIKFFDVTTGKWLTTFCKIQ